MTLPATTRPVPLPQISSRTWEHPADRAALNAMRRIPVFDEVVRKVASFFGERGVRQLFLANAVQVGPAQRPELDALLTEVLATLDWQVRPELYVTESPLANAAAVGFEKPFIIINSELLRVLSREERKFILAHEVGHIISGHTTYRTIALLVMTVGLGSLPFLAGMALLPFQLALLEWYRKSEFSADRAGLLGIQAPDTAYRAFMMMAGGEAEGDTLSVEAFKEQVSRYETSGDGVDLLFRIINTVFRDHPFATVRAAELQQWLRSGEYEQILAGHYVRRGQEPQDLGSDMRDAREYYGEQAREAFSGVADAVGRARDAFSTAFRNRNAPPPGGGSGTGGSTGGA